MDVLPSTKQLLLPGLGVLVAFVAAAIWGEQIGVMGTYNTLIVYVVGFLGGLFVLVLYSFLKGYQDVGSRSNR